MKEQTDLQIEDFFTHLKTMPEYYSIDHIKELIGRPDAIPNHLVSNAASTFKNYFIMITISSIIISTVVFFATNKREEKSIALINKFQQTEGLETTCQIAEEQKREESDQTKAFHAKMKLTEENARRTIVDNEIKETQALEEVETEMKNEETGSKCNISNDENTEKSLFDMPLSKCSWPSDTVLNGQNMILELSKEELEKVGFMVNNTGLYYKNEYEGKKSNFHSRMENGSGEMTPWSSMPNRHNKKREYSKHDFYPMFMTDYFFRPNGANYPIARFDKVKDVLVPVKVSQSLLSSSQWDMPHILWFRATPTLYDVLPKRYSSVKENYPCIEEVRKNTGRQDIVQYQFEPLIRVAQYVSLDQLTLEKIGFKFSEDRIVYTQHQNNCKIEILLKYNSKSTHLTSGPKTNLTNDYNLIFLSDSIGYQSVKWACDSLLDKFTMAYFKNRNETLIPIEIKKEDYSDILNKNLIFWFEPTTALRNQIPGQLGKQIRKEYNYLVSDFKAEMESTCTFFEACRSTLHLHNFEISPNPTSGEFKIKFEAGEPTEITTHITSLNGQILKRLSYFRDVRVGLNSFDFNIGDVPSGMYLLTVQTEKGFLSKRLIVEK